MNLDFLSLWVHGVETGITSCSLLYFILYPWSSCIRLRIWSAPGFENKCTYLNTCHTYGLKGKAENLASAGSLKNVFSV